MASCYSLCQLLLNFQGATALFIVRSLRSFNKKSFFLTPEVKEIIHPDTKLLKYHLNRKMQKLTLQVTQRCNLRCDYCVYSGMYLTRTHEPKSMTFEVAKLAIDYILEHSVDEKRINFGFYGGEPLLELELIEKCIAYISARAFHKEVSYSITTNGTLLTPEIFERLVNRDLHIMVSLDGPKEVHDSARKYEDGRGSFDDIMKNVLQIQERYPEDRDKLSFNAVISPNIGNSCAEELYKMSEILPYYDINMSLLSDTYIDEKIKYNEIFSAIYVREQTKLFLHMLGRLSKENVSRLMYRGLSIYRDDYKLLNRIERLLPNIHPGGPCLAGAQRLFCNVDGVFFPCERVSEISEPMKIGNVFEGIDEEKVSMLINVGKLTEEECKNCWAILRCSMCAMHCDNLKELSREMRLLRCQEVMSSAENSLKDICFLKLNGYDFD